MPDPIEATMGVIGAGAGIAGSVLGSNAQDRASQRSADAQNRAIDLQERIYNQQRQDYQPYMDMGTQGIGAYNSFVNNPNAYLSTPAYQWQQQQIDKNMNRQLSARGRSNSTYGMNSLANAYGELGTREYQNAYNRMLDPIKIGQGAASAAGSAGQNYGGAVQSGAYNLGNIYAQQGNNQASLYGNLGAMPLNLYGAYNTMQNNAAMRDYLGGNTIRQIDYLPEYTPNM